ncbi:hypothetical protein [Bacillus pumilus]|uniref:hypothetical protein n=2 Tax=Bacillus pumilus TaxID=1408 RepID=UPI0011A9A839|nr:hypothetical protein [Bacillus pumilus]
MMIKLSPEEIDAISQKWEDQGKPKCDHIKIGKEYMFGAHSDYACLSCGMRSLDLNAFKKEG